LRDIFADLAAGGSLVVRVRDKSGGFSQPANQRMRERGEKLASGSFGAV